MAGNGAKSAGAKQSGAKKKEVKKETGLGLTNWKADNFEEWYSEVVVNTEMIEYYDISGCYILRPWAMSIWEILQEQKRLQEQFAVEQEALFGSRSATKKPLGQSTNANTIIGTPIGQRMLTPSSSYGTLGKKERRESGKVNNVIPVNYVALTKDDSVSRGS